MTNQGLVSKSLRSQLFCATQWLLLMEGKLKKYNKWNN
jgi:hypothetical protein